jgi:hypothetical protein
MLIVPVIGGFTQHEGNWDGSQELRELLLAEVRDYSPIAVRIFYKRWKEDWKDVARQMHLWRLRYYPEPVGVMACAYSWGVGNGLYNLAKNLARYGINVNVAVCCDGIYLHPWLSYITQWRAFCDSYTIKLPKNVLQVHGFYQRVDWPHGLNLCEEDRCGSWTELVYPHVEMDDAPEYHAKCLEVLRDQVKKFVGGKADEPATAPQPETVEAKAAEKQEAKP